MAKESSETVAKKAVEEAAAGTLHAIKGSEAPRVDKFIYNSHDAEVIKGNQHAPSAWLHGPAHLELLRAAVGRLVKVSELRGDADRNITHVRAARLKGTKKIYVWPVSKDDPEAIPVTGTGTSRYINVVSLLAPQNLTVETGHRERFAVDFAGDESPAGPALVMNLDRQIDRRLDGKRKSAKTTTSPTES